MKRKTETPFFAHQHSNVIEFVAEDPEQVVNAIETLSFLESRVNWDFGWDVEKFSETEGEIVFNCLESADTAFRLLQKMNRHSR